MIWAVVPKKSERSTYMRDPLEIFTDRERLFLKKYSPSEIEPGLPQEYAGCNYDGYLVLITDGDHVVAASGSGKRDFEGKPISGQLEEIIGERKSLVASDDEKTFVKLTADDAGEYRQQAISTIICEGDAIGAVILCLTEELEKMGETESKPDAAAAGFLGDRWNSRTENWKKAFETSVSGAFQHICEKAGRHDNLIRQ